ncbi:Uncharacterised protein [Vibrio cholerae]|nr:Uncharacterised protein [Vibrio cholerae]
MRVRNRALVLLATVSFEKGLIHWKRVMSWKTICWIKLGAWSQNLVSAVRLEWRMKISLSRSRNTR